MRFEARTPAIAETIALGAAVDYVQAIGMRPSVRMSKVLVPTKGCLLSGLNLIRTAPGKSGVVSFTMDCIRTLRIIDHDGIRAGHHCCTLMDHLDLPSTARASVGIYSRPEDFDALATSLEKVRRIFG